ncbi:MAG TPA: bacteriohemerythrin [Bacteroidales bacterium]|nr:MAG: Bacteriohemerythrin [Bacteroidetes bacterium ADurb.Bin217]HPH16147.1 bacteriohemerythrin [Bacteroidales bacterium]HPM12798.1 bacteriohemerythrin [Bacteroidales bacterium]
MSLIVWNSSYETGISEIDNEHKVFVSIIQRLETAIAAQDKVQVMNIIEELLKYADFHFTSEENIMIREEYPDYQWHKRIHERLLIELRDKIHIMKYEFIDLDLLLKFVIAWFNGHTREEDKKISAYVAQKYR